MKRLSPQRIALVAGIAVGLGLGLLYAWVIDPAELARTSPRLLHHTYRRDWVQLAALSYVADGDLARAQAPMGPGPQAAQAQRADGDAVIVVSVALEQLAQHVGDEAVVADGSIIGGDVEVLAKRLDLVDEKEQVLAPRGKDGGDLVAGLGEGLDLGIDEGDAHAAGGADHAPVVLDLGGPTQRAEQIGDRVAHALCSELPGAEADGLKDDADGALLGILVGDGQGHALALLVDAKDNELPGLRLARDARGGDL